MVEEEETSISPGENVEGESTAKDDLVGAEVVPDIERKFVDSEFVGHEPASFDTKNDEMVVEKEGVLSPCSKTVAEATLDGGESSVACESTTVVEEIPNSESKLEREHFTELPNSEEGRDGGMETIMKIEEEVVKESDVAHLPEVHDFRVEETAVVETEIGVDTEAETVKGAGVGSVAEVDGDKSLVAVGVEAEAETVKGAGVESGAEVDGDKSPVAVGVEAEAETVKVAGVESGAELDGDKSLVEKENEVEDEKENEVKEGKENEVEEEKETEVSLVGHILTVETSMETESVTEPSMDGGNNEEDEAMEELEESENVGVASPMDDEDEAMAADEVEAEEVEADEVEAEETETELLESVKGTSSGKRKRGKISKAPTRSPGTRKTIEEDVCFICFDGGDLVLCDRRNCPKAYHPSCVNRDEEFFQAKGRWNCGWHLCSICSKNAEYMCYTCTFSLCKACIKNAVILCVRGKKGFCETCMKMVMLIENNEKGNKKGDVDFDDKSSWEYLFKDYWIDLKAKLSLSLAELSQAKNPWKGFELAGKQESAQLDVKDTGGSGSENPSENLEAVKKKRKKARKLVKSVTKEEESSAAAGAEGSSMPDKTEWASKELLEFVMHMKNGDKSVTSQFDVQALLLEYVNANKLRDPRRKSIIMCDARLENLFGKARVGHFEMLKLLESHFLVKEDSQVDDAQGSVVDTEVSQVDDDETTEMLAKVGKDRKRKMRKKGDGRGPQSNRDDYAAIDIHNISLIYLRRKLVEDLLEDIDTFHDKVVGTFVRIRILVNNQKQDMYRLVQVTGTSKAEEPYKLGKKTVDIMLEILNLSKTEVISIDSISNQEFTEEECKRLRQSIKCGLINRLTVGDILDKAMEVQAARVNDWLETEVVRISHLRDRASETGRRKELRECVEKLQLLKTPEERFRRLEEIPVIHDDPKMDPNYDSEDNTDDDKKQEVYMRSRSSSFSRRGRDPIPPGRGDFSPKDSWSGNTRSSSRNWELNRNLSDKNFPAKFDDATPNFEMDNVNSWNQGRDQVIQQAENLEKPSSGTDLVASPTDLPALVPETAPEINETEKMWHYKDPSGKVQGPFSMVQLRKWSKNGYFPGDLKIWRNTGMEDDGLLLTDAVAGRFASLDQRRESQDGQRLDYVQSRGAHISHGESVPSSQSRSWAAPVDLSKVFIDGRNDSANLPSPTPKQSASGLTGGEVGPYMGSSSFPGGNGGLQSPTPDSAQLARSSTQSAVNPGGNKEHNAVGSLGGSTIPRDSSSSNSAVGPANNPEQGMHVTSTSSLQTSQSDHLVSEANNIVAAHMAQSVSGQNPSGGSHGWGNASSQNLQPNPSINMPGQTLAYNQWGGVPPMVQNPAGNFPSQVVPLHQPEPWGPLPVPGNQPNMQQLPPPPNVTWGMMPPNPNMGWVGSAPGNSSMNWGPTVQGAVVPGNVNPTWVLPTGHPGGAIQVQGPVPGNVNPGWVAPTSANPGAISQGIPPNQGWVGPPTPGSLVPGNGNPGWGMGSQSGVVQGLAPGNANPGWCPPPGSEGATVQGITPGNANPGWGPPTGNQGAPLQAPTPGNTNPGWGTPAWNQVAPVQGPAAGNMNQGWVTPSNQVGIQGPAPGNTNPGWGPTTGNQGATVQGQAPGNTNNPGWGSPAAGSQGTWASEQQQQNGDGLSGQRRNTGSQGGDSGFRGRRPWKRQSSLGRRGPRDSPRSSGQQIVCPYYPKGRCNMGTSCKFLHN